MIVRTMSQHSREYLGLSEKTIRKGRRELDAELASCPVDRLRAPGGGRPAAEVHDLALEEALEQILAPETAGDPQSKARYKRSSLRQLSARSESRGTRLVGPRSGAC